MNLLFLLGDFLPPTRTRTESFHTLSAVSDCIRLYAVIGFRYSQNVRASDIGNLKVMVARLGGQTGHSRVDCEVIELKVTRFKDPSC